jgi:hypothetical protein
MLCVCLLCWGGRRGMDQQRTAKANSLCEAEAAYGRRQTNAHTHTWKYTYQCETLLKAGLQFLIYAIIGPCVRVCVCLFVFVCLCLFVWVGVCQVVRTSQVSKKEKELCFPTQQAAHTAGIRLRTHLVLEIELQIAKVLRIVVRDLVRHVEHILDFLCAAHTVVGERS